MEQRQRNRNRSKGSSAVSQAKELENGSSAKDAEVTTSVAGGAKGKAPPQAKGGQVQPNNVQSAEQSSTSKQDAPPKPQGQQQSARAKAPAKGQEVVDPNSNKAIGAPDTSTKKGAKGGKAAKGGKGKGQPNDKRFPVSRTIPIPTEISDPKTTTYIGTSAQDLVGSDVSVAVQNGSFVVSGTSQEVLRSAVLLLETSMEQQSALVRRRSLKDRLLNDVSHIEEEIQAGLRVEFTLDRHLLQTAIGRNASNIQKVTAECGVTRVVVEKDTCTIRIVGDSAEGVERARRQLQIASAEVPVSDDAIGYLVGKSGQNIENILHKTGVMSIDVVNSGRGSGKVAKILGTSESVESARLLVAAQLKHLEFLEAEAQEVDALREQLKSIKTCWGDEPRTSDKGKGAGGRGGSMRAPGDKGYAVPLPSAPAPRPREPRRPAAASAPNPVPPAPQPQPVRGGKGRKGGPQAREPAAEPRPQSAPAGGRAKGGGKGNGAAAAAQSESAGASGGPKERGPSKRFGLGDLMRDAAPDEAPPAEAKPNGQKEKSANGSKARGKAGKGKAEKSGLQVTIENEKAIASQGLQVTIENEKSSELPVGLAVTIENDSVVPADDVESSMDERPAKGKGKGKGKGGQGKGGQKGAKGGDKDGTEN